VVTAAIQRQAVPGQIGALFPHLELAVQQAGPDLDATIRANALIQAARLQELSPLLTALVAEGKLKIAAAYFDIRNGAVTRLDD
jgi:carbonic anhydrase